jgi:hypothetical protein
VAHPKNLSQIFASRLGLQNGARKSAFNNVAEQQVKFDSAYAFKSIAQHDYDLKGNRVDEEPLPAVLRVSSPDEVLLSVELTLTKDAADTTDLILRFSPGAAPLIASGHDYYPVGVLYNGILLNTKVDDPLFTDLRKSDEKIQLVYQVPYDDLAGEAAAKGADEVKIKPNVFIAFKRMAYVDLSGKLLHLKQKPPVTAGIVVKPKVASELPQPAAAASPSTPPISNAPATPGAIPAAAPAQVLPDRVVGQWMGSDGGTSYNVDISAAGALSITSMAPTGHRTTRTAQLAVQRDAGDMLYLSAIREGGNAAESMSIRFIGPDQISLSAPGQSPLTLNRR